MKNENTALLVVLVSAWTVYGICQHDIILPAIASIIIFLSYLKQKKARSSRHSFFNIPWMVVVGISVLLGTFWRGSFPIPETSSSFTPRMLAAMQSGAIFGALFVWFRPSFPRRSYYLKFLAWTTVALSINVAFDGLISVIFWLFCFINIGFMLAKSWRRSGFFLPALFTVTAAVIFITVVGGVHIGDKAFMHLVSDYILSMRRRGHFLGMHPTLRLAGPGTSGRDIRPVLEIDRNGRDVLYLKTQVFEEYNDGTWTVPENVPRQLLPGDADAPLSRMKLIMFDHMEDVIPSPAGVAAVKGKRGSFEKDLNGIVYSDTKRKTRKVSIFLDETRLPVTVNRERIKELTELPGSLKTALKEYVDPVAGEIDDPLRIARSVENYFRKNFQYSLDIDFHANDKGILLLNGDNNEFFENTVYHNENGIYVSKGHDNDIILQGTSQNQIHSSR